MTAIDTSDHVSLGRQSAGLPGDRSAPCHLIVFDVHFAVVQLAQL